jgi:hypothetical protein
LEEEPFDEDDMYGLDKAMTVVSESTDEDDEMYSDVHDLFYFTFIAYNIITGRRPH